MVLTNLRLMGLGLLALAVTWLVGDPAGAQPGSGTEEPVRLLIRLPANAELYIDGKKTMKTGREREFESPPVPVGKNYYYMIRAVWRDETGKEFSREQKFHVKAGQTNELDLTVPETPAKPKAVPHLKLTAPRAVEVRGVGKEKINLKIERDNVKGPVKITFANVPAGIKLSDLVIPADVDSASAELTVTPEVRAGTSDLLVLATTGDIKDEARIKLTIKEPPPPEKPKEKVKEKLKEKPPEKAKEQPKDESH
jgi:uncharacterized protein (TIGR03000 family)